GPRRGRTSRGGVTGGSQGSEQFPADHLAAAACFGTHPTVLVVVSVAGALVRTHFAGFGAGLQDRAGEVGVVTGVPGQHPPSGFVDIGAVWIGADAHGELRTPVLAPGVVCSGGACLSAFVARFDASLLFLLFGSARTLRMVLRHLSRD